MPIEVIIEPIKFKLLKEFIMKVKNYIKLEYCNDPKDVNELYLKSLKGKIDPSKGYMVKL